MAKNPKISWVTPRIGIAEDADNGIAAGGTGEFTVINVAGEINNPHSNVGLPLVPEQCEKNKLDFLTNWINRWIKSESGRLVIHCRYGMDRSPLVVAWYLYRFRDMTLDEAYQKIRNVHPKANDRRDWVVKMIPTPVETKNGTGLPS